MAVAPKAVLPHLIVILVDDLGWHNVGWHNPLQKSPNIDALASSGAILERHYTYRFCSPSRSALLSGRLPIHVNEDNPPSITSKGGIDLRMTLLPQKLKQAGYTTATYGKWHLGARQWPNIPTNRGFDHHLGFLTGGEDHYTQLAYEAVAKGVPKPVDLWQQKAPAYGRNGTYSCHLYGGEATKLIESHDASTPLFLYMAFQNTHAPYQCPDRYLDPTVDFQGRRLMQGMLTCVDEATGNMTRLLKAKGMWANTLLLWSADNGGPQYWNANNYPLRGGKGTDFEGGVRAAAFLAGGFLKLPAGSTIHHPIHIADWYATFCKLAGVAPEDDTEATRTGAVPQIDSIDQGALLTTVGAPAARTEVPLSFQALILGDLKLVLNTTAVLGKLSGYWTGAIWPTDKSHTPTEADPGCPKGGCLFNLSADVTEHAEISAKLPHERDRLRARLDALLQTKFQTNWTDPRYDECTTLAEYIVGHKGFAGPICSRS